MAVANGMQKFTGREASNLGLGQNGFTLIREDSKEHFAAKDIAVPEGQGLDKTGAHAGLAAAATLTTAINHGWEVDSLVGLTVKNTTISESAAVTANTNNTVTGTLSGSGAWGIGDTYELTSATSEYHLDIASWIYVRNITQPEGQVVHIFNEESGGGVGDPVNYHMWVMTDPGDIQVSLWSYVGEPFIDIWLPQSSVIDGNFSRIKVKGNISGQSAYKASVLAYRA